MRWKCIVLVLSALVILTGTVYASSIDAIVIDFEGVALPDTQTYHYDETLTFYGFDVYIPHGHIQGRPFKQTTSTPMEKRRPDSGSDWFLFDHGYNGANNTHNSWNSAFVITRANGGLFSIKGFETSEWYYSFHPGTNHPEDGTFNPNTQLTVTGQIHNGGIISTTFTTDSVFGFEKFAFSPEWRQLEWVSFLDPDQNSWNPHSGGGRLGFDNIEVTATPEPASMLLFTMGLLGLVGFRKKYRNKIGQKNV